MVHDALFILRMLYLVGWVEFLYNFHCLALKSTEYNETAVSQSEYVTTIPSKLMVNMYCMYVCIYVAI